MTTGEKLELLNDLYGVVNQSRDTMTIAKIAQILKSLVKFEAALDEHIIEIYKIVKGE